MSDCGICLNSYTEDTRIPKSLPCGHSCCLPCLHESFRAFSKFECSECGYSIFDPNVIHSLPVNHALLNLIKRIKIRANQFGTGTPFPNDGLLSSLKNSRRNLTELFQRIDISDKNENLFEKEATKYSMEQQRDYNVQTERDGIFIEKDVLTNNLQGVAAEKCLLPTCNNLKAVQFGMVQPFCSPSCAQLYHTEFMNKPNGAHSSSFFQTNNYNSFVQNIIPKDNAQVIQNSNSIFKQSSSRSLDRSSGFRTPDVSPNRSRPIASITPFTTPRGPMIAKSTPSPLSSQPIPLGASAFERALMFPNVNQNFIGLQTPRINADDINGHCSLPGCANPRYVLNGSTLPFCGKRCYDKWRSLHGGNQSRVSLTSALLITLQCLLLMIFNFSGCDVNEGLSLIHI
eukprot:TRINITY_DN7054_c0_g1_i3.p1 TRINITY_DN7054_c0_g1~~TRINITY_DN7054_c0_g1_i3.p1  ORF type:complete len:400 (+),score=7.24 TRINITY_DN7054_c0_g1_i3:121-1320(+)